MASVEVVWLVTMIVPATSTPGAGWASSPLSFTTFQSNTLVSPLPGLNGEPALLSALYSHLSLNVELPVEVIVGVTFASSKVITSSDVVTACVSSLSVMPVTSVIDSFVETLKVIVTVRVAPLSEVTVSTSVAVPLINVTVPLLNGCPLAPVIFAYSEVVAVTVISPSSVPFRRETV